VAVAASSPIDKLRDAGSYLGYCLNGIDFIIK